MTLVHKCVLVLAMLCICKSSFQFRGRLFDIYFHNIDKRLNIWPRYGIISSSFLYCSKGRQCIPDVNGDYFQHRDPKKYGTYCRNMRSNCHGPVCKYTSEDTNDDIDPPGKYNKCDFFVPR